jgi:hypothetical protein
MLVLPGRSWTSCQKLDKKFHPFWVVSRPDPPTGVDLKVARAVVADMGGEIIVITVVAAAVVTAAAVEVTAATQAGIRKMNETSISKRLVLCVVGSKKYIQREIL